MLWTTEKLTKKLTKKCSTDVLSDFFFCWTFSMFEKESEPTLGWFVVLVSFVTSQISPAHNVLKGRTNTS